MGVTTVAAFLTQFGILVADLAYTFVDPNITFQSSQTNWFNWKTIGGIALTLLVIAVVFTLAGEKYNIGTLIIQHGPKAVILILASSVLYGGYIVLSERAYWKGVFKQLFKDSLVTAALICLIFLFGVAIFAPLIANDKPLVMKYKESIYFPAFRDFLPEDMRHYKEFAGQGPAQIANQLKSPDYAIMPPVSWNPYQIDLGHFLEGSSKRHKLGTDDTGRDLFARIIHGTRIALSVGFVAVGIYVWIGIVLGALAGYYGGWVDIIISRMIEVMMSIPTFFLIIAVIAFLEPSIYNVMAAIGLVGWTGTARLVRGEFLKLRNKEFVDASLALGARDPRVIFRHILPNALTPVLVVATFGIADAIFSRVGA